MLRLACDTAAVDELLERLRSATTSMSRLRDRVEAGEPWPLSRSYGAEPESSWGPPEVLAHVAEMIPYWLGEIDRIVSGDPAAPVPFGRVATDPDRIERIGRDRELPFGELFDRIERSSNDAANVIATLSPAERARVGSHPRRGEMSVSDSFEQFIVRHLEEHVEQLEDVVSSRETDGGTDPAAG
jgi:hypothetical protein